MSGGVDSSVTAALLAQSSFDLSAVYMRNWDTRDENASDTGCEWEKDWEDVQRVCQKLKIPCTMVDLSRDYWNRVFEPALQVWREGRTPNPDVSCNREIKFGVLRNHEIVKDAWLATGHYARIEWDTSLHGKTSPLPKLLRGVDRIKDQSYWLSSVSESNLRKVMFPIGHLNKTKLREMAEELQLPTAKRKESMGICFVGKKRSFPQFLQEYIPTESGNIVTLDGKVVGSHTGLWQYTVGENARIGGQPKRLFVCSKNVEQNEIVVVDDPDHPVLSRSTIHIDSFHWIWNHHPPSEVWTEDGLQVDVKIRSVMQPVPAVLRLDDEGKRGQLAMLQPQKGVAEGQIAVFYQRSSDWCLGSATITAQ
ncbi:hypothetical protein M408DRAFT_327893 [Serendipita vermifera MAFF 305830]|uniref:tRNA-5-taurinomethyluridine 2-sulfurtransferase n=1 Tax=Serendipita vermifera MAFF 305830 TaxID=933852 RepID=A0A0C2WY06_SERVB|nr:hypothetical protein M408DRAFT_327893 [Serendipita vermifera MAFF 305830]